MAVSYLRAFAQADCSARTVLPSPWVNILILGQGKGLLHSLRTQANFVYGLG